MTRANDNDRIADAIDRTFSSPNVSDSNGEPANVVDVLDDIARAIFSLAQAVREHTASTASQRGPTVERRQHAS
jgi:hypothetical protein